MVTTIGSCGPGPLDLTRLGSAVPPTAEMRNGGPAGAAGAVAKTPAARLAALGAPVDADRIATLRAAIAEGRYKIDPEAIATAMIASDLPIRP